MISTTLSAKPRNTITIRSLVSECKRSWRWQDAYRIASYAMVRFRDGRLGWRSGRRSEKLSMPQVRRRNIQYDYVGTLHNRVMTASEAPILRGQLIALIGPDRAARYERLACRMVRGLKELT